MVGKKSIYENNVFRLSKERYEVALLPDIGKFCKCGCNKRLETKVIHKKLSSGRTIMFRRGPAKNQEFLNSSHKSKYYYALKGQRSKRSLHCTLSLPLNDDQSRTIAVYLTKDKKEVFTLKRSNDPLWLFLNRIAKFRGYIN